MTIEDNIKDKKIYNFFIENKSKIIFTLIAIFIFLIGYFSFEEFKKKNRTKMANQYNSVILNFNDGDKINTVNELINMIEKKDATYSPLALYFLIDNNLIEEKNKINELFDILINKKNLQKEIKNLIIYKKALYNSDIISENELLQILNPVINSESIWKPHALYLVAEYFYSKKQTEKSKEFFNKILSLPNVNKDIQLESKKRLTRDLSE